MKRYAFAVVLCLPLAVAGCRMDRAAAQSQLGIRDRIGRRLADGAEKKAETREISGIKVSIWRPKDSGKAPLVIFSHGFHGSSTQSTFLMKALADHGYLVIAPNHKDARGGSGASMRPETAFENPGAWSDATYKDRAEDITRLLRALKTDPAW